MLGRVARSLFVTAAVAAAAAPIVHAQTPADLQTIANHRLTLDHVKKVMAVDAAILQMVIANPDLAKKAAGLKPGMSLDDAVKAIGAIPEASAVLKSNGIGAREYILTMGAMLSTSMMYDFTGGNPPQKASEAAKANFAFWREHQATLKAAIAEWQKTRAELMKRAPK